jgi:hypothetical protein
MFGLAALAAVAAMAFVGASSAMGENTAICKVHEEPCASGNIAQTVHMVAGTTILETDLTTVLCLGALGVGTTEGLGAPAGYTITSLTWSNCGTTSAHNNCTVTTLQNGLLDVLKTALNLGTAAALGTEVLVECNILLGFHCIYGGGEVKGFKVEGALHTAGAGHGMFTAKELLVPKVGGLICPKESFWTALFEPLEHIYGVS